MKWPDMPTSWIVCVMFVSLIYLRYLGIDSFTTAGISMLIGYVVGKHIEGTRYTNGRK